MAVGWRWLAVCAVMVAAGCRMDNAGGAAAEPSASPSQTMAPGSTGTQVRPVPGRTLMRPILTRRVLAGSQLGAHDATDPRQATPHDP